jgi:phage shock protein A
MALLERVSTLVRANLNDLIDRAEHPEKMIKQVMLDMQNQLMQVKTQVAIAIADEHLLLKKQKENEEKAAEWARKAELAVDKKQDDLARAALERELTCRQMAESFAQQVADQKTQVETLKSALHKLEQKLQEAQLKSEMMMAQHRRSRTLSKTSEARMTAGSGSAVATFDRMKNKVSRAEAISQARAELAGNDFEDRLAALGKEDEIEKLLTELKARRNQS